MQTSSAPCICYSKHINTSTSVTSQLPSRDALTFVVHTHTSWHSMHMNSHIVYVSTTQVVKQWHCCTPSISSLHRPALLKPHDKHHANATDRYHTMCHEAMAANVLCCQTVHYHWALPAANPGSTWPSCSPYPRPPTLESHPLALLVKPSGFLQILECAYGQCGKPNANADLVICTVSTTLYASACKCVRAYVYLHANLYFSRNMYVHNSNWTYLSVWYTHTQPSTVAVCVMHNLCYTWVRLCNRCALCAQTQSCKLTGWNI